MGPTIFSPFPSVSSENQVDGGEGSNQSSRLSPFSSSVATVTAYTNSLSDSDAEDIAFDVQPSEGRLPQSSYTEEDSLFTWTDITGTHMS